MNPPLEHKLTRLRDLIGGWKKVLVAYSGGVDSALVLAIAVEQLHANALACIGVSPSYPRRELRRAIELADRLGARYRQIDTMEHLDANYLANAENRCYFCKTHLYQHLRRVAESEGFANILDGVNASDRQTHVYGHRAAGEQQVLSPLLTLGITKEEVRQISRELGLPVWDKPAMACLSSRVPHGTAITPEILEQIEQAEDALVELGFSQFRVRHHGDIARIEIPSDEFSRALDWHEQIVEGVRAAGYRYVTLDLAGFRKEPAETKVELSIHRAG